jgi:hypothetical protein
MRFNPSLGTQGFDGGLNSGILRYEGADAVDPTTEFEEPKNALVESKIAPLEKSGTVRFKVFCSDAAENLLRYSLGLLE